MAGICTMLLLFKAYIKTNHVVVSPIGLSHRFSMGLGNNDKLYMGGINALITTS